MINVVFPVLNEELRLEKGIQTVVPFLSEHWMGNFQITIVDNGSTDKTEQLCQQLCKKYNEIKYLRIEEKGVGVAFRYAVEQNECEIIGYTDIDLSTELEAFVQMKKAFEEDQNLEIVNASRFNKKSNLVGRTKLRNFISYSLIFILKKMFGMKASSDEKGWFLLIEILLRAERDNRKILELPITWIYDENTKVKIIKTVKSYMKQMIKLKRAFRREANE